MCMVCCGELLHNPQRFISELQDKKQIPTYMKMANVSGGYRLNHGVWDCVRSLFKMHNETFNIYTALLPFVFFVYITVAIAQRDVLSMMEKIVTSVYTLTACFSFAASTLFHLFGSISKRAHIKLLQLDMIGIALLIGGSYFPCTYFAFENSPATYITYLSIVTILTLTCCFIFVVPKYAMGYTGFRITVFASVAGFGLVVIGHIIYENGFSNAKLTSQVIRVFYTYGMYALGIVFYASKVPESLVGPKWKFTQYFHSHNIWHIFVFLGTLVHYLSIEHMLNFVADVATAPVRLD
mmetsp:Transcript_7824/g.11612  ORF Transcript_7824/g.11612 Transcript_7824/m.11612 type:complete len:295 (+) Transcript_7824:28-912(+)